ncbi:competence/damage-inducible protein A [Thermoflavimicrobium dichotomicum]|uniref:Putative competence-damage inducible protein n=1 Tax=Thermoflavimicrobium dichotomicum TaxID=46223 RepID=A0A1I3PT10_9BACL|nr:competence/damage-inducible protein A [Thermoflavimicrobium dichotomicum]SFJ24693.1 nicotinamide-nucleotide amidase [Thermoflavimicrobium dichotomicum]
MNAEIITVGTELISGKTLDQHSQYLSRECYSLGIPVYYHTSVGDNDKHLYDVIQQASLRSQLVFICGGLGPTDDDLSKEILARFLQEELVQDSEVLAHLAKFFAKRSGSIPPNNFKQTYVFKNGVVFQNQHGTAPGLAVTKNNVTYILLPGPPKELQPMFETSVRPFLMQLLSNQSVIVLRDLAFFGIGESRLEEVLYDLIQNQSNPQIATYALDAGVILRLTAFATDQEEAQRLITPLEKEIFRRVGNYCYSTKNESLEEVVFQSLNQQKKTVAFAESCTGGLTTHLLTIVPGSSKVLKGGLICYTNEIKSSLVKVPEEILETHGAVSFQTAKWLAENTREQFASDFALSITGVAGPESVENKPVGMVWIGLAEEGKTTRVYQLDLHGSRRRIQLMAAKYALFILQQRLKKGEPKK